MYIQILLLREKCPNTKFFVVRIFPHLDCPHLDCTRRDTPYLSVFSPNAGKYGPEKSPYLDTFHTVVMSLGDFMEIWEYTNHIRLYFMECISLFTDQKRAHNNKCFSEVYSQHCKTFNLEIFVKLLTGFRC